MTSLLHFEEKVHRKKLHRADVIPLLFPRLLCQILEHLGYPSEPSLSIAAFAETIHSRQMESFNDLCCTSRALDMPAPQSHHRMSSHHRHSRLRYL
ncbi:hypothetical protein CK203_052507 [Vitis vinifera]|uniref:Uncharacterized protein n=1 Tax=Vitis vinifera TaxID=29760 RepID=A0A438HCD3_VITVI|nr:hypothetical protein CK203_052507 [Vitis vinifera]